VVLQLLLLLEFRRGGTVGVETLVVLLHEYSAYAPNISVNVSAFAISISAYALIFDVYVQHALILVIRTRYI
jgi:hypothetical protein